MTSHVPDPTRWCDEPGEEGASEGKPSTGDGALAMRFRSARQATEPNHGQLATLRRTRNVPPSGHAARQIWRLAFVMVLWLAMGGAVGAAFMKWRRPAAVPAESVPLPSASVSEVRRARISSTRRVAEEAPVAPVAPLAPVAPVAPVALDATSEPVPDAVSLPIENPARAGSRLSSRRRPGRPERSEAGVLAAAFRKLRSDTDAAAALRVLDDYDVRFPTGVLRGESLMARAEALIALHRRAEALPVLERLESSGGAVSRHIRITRSELYAESGGCTRARPEFDALISVSDTDDAGSRALYGRASCALKDHLFVDAARDLTRYLVVRPEGPLAQAAHRALGALP